MSKEQQNILFGNRIAAKFLVELYSKKEGDYLARLARKLDSTLSSVYKNKILLEDVGLISSVKMSRERRVKLSVKGRKVAKNLLEIKEILGW